MAEQSDGSDPKTFQKTCYECNAILLSTTAKYCSECGLPQHVNEPPSRKQCVHCEFQLPLNAEYCSKCCSPQDQRTYRNSTFKKCCNPQCKMYMLHNLPVCYSCRQEQSSVPIQTPTQECLSTPLKPIQMREVEHPQSLEMPVASILMDDKTTTDLSSPLISKPSLSLDKNSSTPDDDTTKPDIVPYPASPWNERKIVQTNLGNVSNGTALPEISNEINSETPPPIVSSQMYCLFCYYIFTLYNVDQESSPTE